MVLPANSDVSDAHELIGRLGAFLDELTGGRSTAAVHAHLVQAAAGPDPDQRVANVQRDPAGFAAMWDELVTRSAVPATAWEHAVLPAVVAFSNEQNGKAHLELATSYWLAAREAAEVLAKARPADTTADAQATGSDNAVSLPAGTLAGLVPAQVVPRSSTQDSGGPRRRHRAPRRAAWIAAVITALLLIAGAIWWWLLGQQSEHNPVAMTTVQPGQSISASANVSASLPAVIPPATGSPRPAATHPGPSKLPAPTPTWAGPGPSVPPSAPRSLAATAVTSTAITLAWQVPADSGSGGIAYYRIQSNGQDAGWTQQTTVTLNGLTPETSYTFTVTAHNGAGLASPASAAVTVITAAPPATTPSASPSPEPTVRPGTFPPKPPHPRAALDS